MPAFSTARDTPHVNNRCYSSLAEEPEVFHSSPQTELTLSVRQDENICFKAKDPFPCNPNYSFLTWFGLRGFRLLGWEGWRELGTAVKGFLIPTAKKITNWPFARGWNGREVPVPVPKQAQKQSEPRNPVSHTDIASRSQQVTRREGWLSSISRHPCWHRDNHSSPGTLLFN